MSRQTVIGTTGGHVRGVEEGAVRRFSGIPFAHVSRRFRRPEPAQWDGIHDGRTWGPAPWQPLPAYDDPGAPLAEDCLNVNVWAPPGSHGLPVLVWVYGGGWEQGSNASPMTRGDLLAATGRVVVASINYRVTALGWGQFAHRGGPLADATNLGLHDITAGLEWIRDNIAAFGGDPTTVTVMGESAGGFSLGALVGSPRARDTFHRIAAFSGAASRIIPMTAAAALGDSILEQLGGDPISCPPEQLLTAQRTVVPSEIGRRNAAVPESLGVVDDTGCSDGLLDRHPFDAIRNGDTIDKVMWLGSTRDEASLFAAGAPADFAGATAESLVRDVAMWTQGHASAAAIAKDYIGSSDSLSHARQRLITDWVYRLPAARAALAQSSAGGTAFLSVVGRADGLEAGHAIDVPCLFGRTESDAGPQSRDRQAALTAAVLDFATTGSPGWEHVSMEPRSCTIGPDDWDSTADTLRVLEVWDGVPRP